MYRGIIDNLFGKNTLPTIDKVPWKWESVHVCEDVSVILYRIFLLFVNK